MEKRELKEKEMTEVVGGQLIVGKTYTTKVEEGYLALRNNTGYDYSNEIGALCNGSTVIVIGEAVGDYVPVTVTNQAQGSWNRNDLEGRVGYVNKNFLV